MSGLIGSMVNQTIVFFRLMSYTIIQLTSQVLEYNIAVVHLSDIIFACTGNFCCKFYNFQLKFFRFLDKFLQNYLSNESEGVNEAKRKSI